MPVLYDQFGREIPATKTPERRILAAAPVTDAYREYVANGLTPENLAAIFRAADAGEMRQQAELFDAIEEKDGHLLGEKTKRQNVILDVDFEVQPATDDARDAKVADFVRDYLDNMTDFEDVLVALQDAVGKGYSGLEVKWDVSAGQAVPGALDFIEQKRFLFTDATGTLNQIPRLITDDDPMGIEIPAWKMLFHRYGGKSGHPTRSGIYRVCAWMYLFKNYAIKDWVIFCEVFGMPLRLGIYDPGASETDKDALIAAVSSLGTDAAGIISANTKIEFADKVSKTASADLYKVLAQFCNAEMSKAILGQTLSAEAGDTGSYALGKTHEGVRLDLLKADSRAIAATVRNQLIRPIVGFNFGWDTAIPQYVAPWEEEEDLDAKADWMGKLMDRGMRMPVSYIRQEFNIPEPEKDEETIGGMRADQAMVHTAKANHGPANHGPAKVGPATRPVFTPEQNQIEHLVDVTTDLASGAWHSVSQPIQALVASAQNLEEVRDQLAATYADMDPTEFEDLVARAMFAAEMFGRAKAEEKIQLSIDMAGGRDV